MFLYLTAEKIHISEDAYNALKKFKNFHMESRGMVNIKVRLLK